MELSCLTRLGPAYPRPSPVSPHTRHPRLPPNQSNPICAMDPTHTSKGHEPQKAIVTRLNGRLSLQSSQGFQKAQYNEMLVYPSSQIFKLLSSAKPSGIHDPLLQILTAFFSGWHNSFVNFEQF